MKKLICIVSALFLLVCCNADREDSYSYRMVASEMSRCPDGSYLDGMEGQLKWNYTTGLELNAFLAVYEKTGDEQIFNYVQDWYSRIIDEEGKIFKNYKISNHNVDHICPGNALFYLLQKTGDQRYKTALETLWAQLCEQPRTSQGGFWHKQVYPHQMWLDGLYMAQPFYARFVSEYVDDEDVKMECYRDIVNNFLVVAEHTYDSETCLYRHAWDESHEMFWCEKETGRSEHAWGRALGWYVMAMVDVLDYIPEDVEGRTELVKILNGIFEVLPDYADSKTGMWYQVLDCPGREGNYLEATCSCMFSYALLKGVRKGYLPEDFRDWSRKCYEDLVAYFIRENEDGSISLKDCCAVAGLGGKNNRRGDYDYYISEKIIENDAKGVGPFIMASLEYEQQFLD